MTPFALTRPTDAPWQRPAEYWPALQAATVELEPPFGVISLAALAHNAHTMLDRANGTTIRVASKSVRVRQVPTPCSPCPATAECSPTRCPRLSGWPAPSTTS